MVLSGKVESAPVAVTLSKNTDAAKQVVISQQGKIVPPADYLVTMDSSNALYSIVSSEQKLRQVLFNLPTPVAKDISNIMLPFTFKTIGRGLSTVLAATKETIKQLAKLAATLEKAALLFELLPPASLSRLVAARERALAQSGNAKFYAQDILQELLSEAVKALPGERQPVAMQRLRLLLDNVDLPTMRAMLPWTELETAVLRSSSTIVDKYIDLLSQYNTANDATDQGNSTLSLLIPVFFTPKQAYSAHIHIYHEQGDDHSGHGNRRETWLRVLLETVNIGVVEASFHQYQQESVDVRLSFNAELAPTKISNLKEQIRQVFVDKLSLNLGKLDVVVQAAS